MSKVFYDHIILIEEVFAEVDELELTSEEKFEVKKTMDRIIHYRILTFILTQLPREHHETFLIKFSEAPHEIAHMHFLSEKSGKDMHKELFQAGSQIKAELLKELQKHPKKKRA